MTRFLQGTFASCSINNGGGTIGDLVPVHRRGAVMSLFSMGFLFGPVIGPIAGSYLAAAAGWRWVFWLLMILVSLLILILLGSLTEHFYDRMAVLGSSVLLRAERLIPLFFWSERPRSCANPRETQAFTPRVNASFPRWSYSAELQPVPSRCSFYAH